MKISELIEQLKEIKNQEGDLPIMYRDTDWGVSNIDYTLVENRPEEAYDFIPARYVLVW